MSKNQNQEFFENISHENQLKHQLWCFKNGIKIYFEPTDWRKGRIVINNNGQIIRSKTEYNQVKLKVKDERYWEIVFKLYTKFYFESHGEI